MYIILNMFVRLEWKTIIDRKSQQRNIISWSYDSKLPDKKTNSELPQTKVFLYLYKNMIKKIPIIATSFYCFHSRNVVFIIPKESQLC
jgi:hypothetical protein